MEIRKLIEHLNISDILPLKIEDSNISHDMVIYLFALEAGTLHDIYEDILLISIENVTIGEIVYDYPVWLFYSVKAIEASGVNTDVFRYSSEIIEPIN